MGLGASSGRRQVGGLEGVVGGCRGTVDLTLTTRELKKTPLI